MNTTMADGAEQRLDAQIAEALFGQPGMSKMDVANRVRELRADGPALLVQREMGQADALLREVCAQLESLDCGACIGSHAPMEDLHGRIARHLSAQPSPGGQGDARRNAAYDAIDRFLRANMDDVAYAVYEEHLETLFVANRPVRIYGCCAQPEGELHTTECPNMRHLAARQPVGRVPYGFVLNWKHGEAIFTKQAGVAADHRDYKNCTVVPVYAAPPAQAVDLAMPIAMIDQALGHLSTALDDLDSSPDPRPGAMVNEAMACLRQALTGVPRG